MCSKCQKWSKIAKKVTQMAKKSQKYLPYVLFHESTINGILLPNCSSDREKLLKFEAEGWEFAKFLRSLKQFIQTVKGQNKFW